MSWEPLSKSLGSVIDERLSSPLISGFIISWSLFNWKFIAILLSKNTVSKTIELADGLYKTKVDWIGWNVAAPLAAALAYVYVLPLLSRRVTKRWRENQKLIEDDRKLVEELELLDLQTSRRIRAENTLLRLKVDELSTERDEAKEDAKNAAKAQQAAWAQAAASESEASEHQQRASDLKDRVSELTEQLAKSTVELDHLRTITSAVMQFVEPDELIARVVQHHVPSVDNLSTLEVRILNALSPVSALTPVQIGQKISVDTSQISSALARLQVNDLVLTGRSGVGGGPAFRLKGASLEAVNVARVYANVLKEYEAKSQTSK